jgi:hypothetical protein
MLEDTTATTAEPETFTKDYVHTLREENKSWRLKVSEIETSLNETKNKLQGYEQQKTALDEAERIKKGELEKVLTEKTNELESVKSKLATAEAKANEWTTYQDNRKNELLGSLKNDDLKELAKVLPDLQSLEKFVKLHSAGVVIPGTDGNGQPGGVANVALTDDQKIEAGKLGLKEEDYKEVMEYRNKAKEKK